MSVIFNPASMGDGSFLLLENGLASSLESVVGPIPANYTMVYNNYFNLTAVEYFDGTGRLAWDAGIPSFPLQWGLSPSCSVTNNTVIAPDGTLTASSWTENSATSNHMLRAYSVQALQDGSPTRFAVIAKASTRTRIVGALTITKSDLSAETTASVGFDLAGGNVGYDIVAGTGTAISNPTMIPLPGGWWLCTFDVVSTSGYTFWYQTFYLDAGFGTAARNISYAGNGVSGVYVWWANMLPKGMWALRQSFLDDFNSSSTIDLANTRGAGFNWYLANSWANCPMTGFSFNSNPPTVAAGLSVSGSILTWSDITTTVTNYIYTATPVVGNASHYIGQVFAAPALFEARMTWSGAYPASSPTWPAFWADGIEGLTGASNQFLEIDFLEQRAHDQSLMNDSGENVWQGPATQLAGHQNPARNLPNQPGFSLLNMNRYATLWLAAATNNNTGLFMDFFNGFYVSSSFTFGIADPYAIGDAQHMAVILAGGNTPTPPTPWPTYIDYVKIYTR